MPPAWTVVPFALMLLSIAIIPLVKPHWWERNLHKGYISVVLGTLMLVYLLAAAPAGAHERLAVTLLDYVAFIALLGSLFVVSGGIYLRGSLVGTPGVNALILLIGSVLASFMGTTGAAMLLLRPTLRANAWRKSQVHVVIFFTFLVANIGGLLTPLGDPPLYLGFLKGVPFQWTLVNLIPEWAVTVGLVLGTFFVIDTIKYKGELKAGSRPPEGEKEPLGVEGGLNFLWLGLVVATIYGFGMVAKSHFIHEIKHEYGLVIEEAILKCGQATVMAVLALMSLKFTTRKVRERNSFNWEPITEVAVLFIGIFITMIPALWILDELGKAGDLGLDQPWQFFWATGGLSSFLDNAPTYLTFSAAASGLHNQYLLAGSDVPVATDANNLSLLLHSSGVLLRDGAQHTIATGELFLKAISCGAVFMGANTYIGNGPNFMVKTIAEQNGVKMPSFFGYLGYSCLMLLPTFGLITVLFFL
jgi:Na+/H+ antiporter NhaD/arsenite permease-like protein